MCEELDWLPFYPGSSSTFKATIENKHKDGPPNTKAIPIVLDVCSHWIQSFIKYSKWLENPSNVKATRFLSKGYIILLPFQFIIWNFQSMLGTNNVIFVCYLRHKKLKACMEELGIQKYVKGGKEILGYPLSLSLKMCWHT